MKSLQIPYINTTSFPLTMELGRKILEPIAWIFLEQSPWLEAYPYQPEVKFKIAYNDNSIWMIFHVREDHIQGKYRQTNDPVHRDSCVEFFMSMDGLHYYNFEFNCMGTAHVGYGLAKHLQERHNLDRSKVETIQTISIINPHGEECGTSSWELLLNIPLSVFIYHPDTSWKGLLAKGNFYKCGDDLPQPHFVCWNAIHHPTPNFHLPEFFGNLEFQAY